MALAPERENALERADELYQRIEGVTTAQHAQTLLALAVLRLGQGKFQASRDSGQRLFELAQQTNDSLHLTLAHFALGMASYGLVDLIPARHHLEQVATSYDPGRYRSLGMFASIDVGVAALATLAWTLQALGLSDQAQQRSREALLLARQLDHAPSLCFATAFAHADLLVLRREWSSAQAAIVALERLAAQHNLPLFIGWAEFLRYLLQVIQNPTNPQQGLTQMRRCLAAWQAGESRTGGPRLVSSMLEAYGRAGEPAKGLRLLQEDMVEAESTGVRFYEAEMHRLRGWLLLKCETPAPPAPLVGHKVHIVSTHSPRSYVSKSGRADLASITPKNIWCARKKIQGVAKTSYSLLLPERFLKSIGPHFLRKK